MTKITAEHLSDGAFDYIRQSTTDQLMHNQESRRRQYGSAERARQFGWISVEVIADSSCGGRGRTMTKITVEHLSGSGFVCVRQPTADQLMNNQESRRRQYGLTERARQFGCGLVDVIADRNSASRNRSCSGGRGGRQ
jgi:hypothetical protein